MKTVSPPYLSGACLETILFCVAIQMIREQTMQAGSVYIQEGLGPTNVEVDTGH